MFDLIERYVLFVNKIIRYIFRIFDNLLFKGILQISFFISVLIASYFENFNHPPECDIYPLWFEISVRFWVLIIILLAMSGLMDIEKYFEQRKN